MGVLEVLLTPLEILFCYGQLSPALTEASQNPQEAPPVQEGRGSEHSWEIWEFPLPCRARCEDWPTSIHLTFPPHPRELFVGLLSRLGGGGDQVVIDIPLNPTPLGGIFSFFLKTGKRGKKKCTEQCLFFHGTEQRMSSPGESSPRIPLLLHFQMQNVQQVWPAGILQELKLSQSLGNENSTWSCCSRKIVFSANL